MISVIICSIDPVKFQRVTKNYVELLGDEPYEIIGIRDAKSLSEGYNRGIAQARGSLLVFSHDDVQIISGDFKDRLKQHLEEFDVIGVAGTSCLIDGLWISAGQPFIHGVVTSPAVGPRPYVVNIYGAESVVVRNVQALDGLFFAVKRSVVNTLQFDATIFDGFHLYDMDFTFSAYLAGFKLAVCSDILLIHESAGNFGATWQKYNDLFLKKFAGKFCVNAPGPRRCGIVKVGSKEEILRCCDAAELMRLTGKLRL